MQCGLCCDGTFFGSVAVARDESARLERVGFPIVQHDDGSTSLPQRCMALRGRLCDAYDDRPAACAKYACKLRRKVADGERSLDDAFAKVGRMRALLATIRDAFECPPETSVWERILALEEPETASNTARARRDYASAIDAVGELLELGRAEFEQGFAGGGSR